MWEKASEDNKNTQALVGTKGHEIYPPAGPERGIRTHWDHYRSSSETIRALNYDNYRKPLLLT